MTHPSVPDPFAVFNQPAPRDGLPLWVEDPVLRHTLSILPASLLRRPVGWPPHRPGDFPPSLS